MARSNIEKDFQLAIKAAAKLANEAAKEIQTRISKRRLTDEDDITPAFLQELESKFRNREIEGLAWDSKVMRHRKGSAAEEKVSGADFMITIDWKTKHYTQSKGLLVQAKNIETSRIMRGDELDNLKAQCNKMLKITPSAFVMNYTKQEIRATSAAKISGTSDYDLNGQCEITTYNFFKEFFKCSYGDPNMSSIDDFQEKLDIGEEIDQLHLKVKSVN